MEIWDGYLKDGSLAKIDLVRGEPIPKGLYHLVCEVLVRHTDGDYLLMQRDFRKPNYGGYFEATAGGSALRGEDGTTCAQRELLEETGIRAMSLDEIGRYRSHDTIYYQYLCTTDQGKETVSMQQGETIAYRWVTEKEFIAFVNSGDMIPAQRVRYAGYFRKLGYIQAVACMEIKKMETADEIDGKGYVHCKSWQETYAGLIDAEYLKTVTAGKCLKIARNWPDNILVAKDGEKVVGFVGYGKYRDDSLADCGEIFSIYVLADYHSKKIGYQLMNAAFEKLSAYQKIAVWVLKGNERAIRFYERYGFRLDGMEQEIILGTPNTELRMIYTRG